MTTIVLGTRNTPERKRQKLEPAPFSINTGDMVPFLVTSVRGIPSQFNDQSISVGIKGESYFLISMMLAAGSGTTVSTEEDIRGRHCI